MGTYLGPTQKNGRTRLETEAGEITMQFKHPRKARNLFGMLDNLIEVHLTSRQGKNAKHQHASKNFKRFK